MKNLCIILLFSLKLVTFGEYHDKSFRDKLLFTADKHDLLAESLFQISKHCQNTLNTSFTKLPSRAKNIHILLEGQPPLYDSYKVIYFKREDLKYMNSYQMLEQIVKKLVKRTLVAIGGKQNLKVPDWLTAALIFQVQIGQNSLLTQEKFPITRYGIVNKTYPDFDELVDGEKVLSENYWLYRVYAEQCFVIYASIKKMKQGKSLLLEGLSQTPERNVIDILGVKFTEFLSAAGRREWYKENCRKICFDIINPYPPDVIRKKVIDLFSVTVARPGANGTMRIPLEQLSDDESQALDNFYLGFIESDFFNIYMTSSLSIRPSLNDFISSIEILKKGKKEEFKENLRQAKKKFNDSLNYQKNLNSYLDELEQKNNSTSFDFALILEAELLSQTKRRLAFPKWHQYLDDLERKLEAITIE